MTRWAGRVVTTARQHWAARLRAEGSLPCARCGRPVTVDMAWTVEHVLERAFGGAITRANEWVSHRRCNLSAGGKIGAAITNGKRRPVIARLESERDRGIRRW